MFQPPPHCVFDLATGSRHQLSYLFPLPSHTAVGLSSDEMFDRIIATLHSDGIALVHSHWSELHHSDSAINDCFIQFVQSIGGLPHPHSDCEHGEDFVWDVRPLVDTDGSEATKPARSLTADAFEMHTVRPPSPPPSSPRRLPLTLP
jgi:hypothetical protein